MTLDFNRFDFPSIFGVMKSTASMTSLQLRPIRALIQEMAIAKYSGGQLRYIGGIGHDFMCVHDGLLYESKGVNGLFLKTKNYTKEIVLKNFQTENQGLPHKTFDYMLLWDTSSYTLGVCDWEACMKNARNRSAQVTFRADYSDIDFIIENGKVQDKGDFGVRLNKLIYESI